jgi:hypothetical protein
MAAKKIVAVLGATGAQGGSLCEAILSDPDSGFSCRALTRNPGSDGAKALAAKGVQVVAADLDDEASLTEAFAGAYGIYGVTNYPEIFRLEGENSVAREQQQATNIARAAKAANAAHVIWSTLDDTTQWLPVSDARMPTLLGKYKCPHTDSKGQIDHVFTDLGLPVTFLLTCFYWDNFYKFGWGPRKNTGSIGKKIGIAGEHLSGVEMAEKCSTALGIMCTFSAPSPDAYRNRGFPGADDLGNMFQIFDEFQHQYRASRSVEASRALAPSLMSFDQWLAKNKSRIPL